MIKASTILTLAVLALPALAAAEEGQTVEVTSEGTGADKRAACSDAKSRALRSAVEQVAGVFVGSDTLVKDSMLVHDKILTRADGFVSGHKILSEQTSAVTGSSALLCTVKVSATVEKSKIGDEMKKIAAAFAARGRPKVLLMIAEQAVGTAAPVGWWQGGKEGGATGPAYKSTQARQVETKMMEDMAKQGWRFVDPEVLVGKITLKGPVSANPSNDDLREFGKLSAAEVVIYGRAVAEEVTQGTGATDALVNVPSKIDLRAVATDTGEIYASYTDKATAPGFTAAAASTAAFNRLASKAAGEISRRVVDRWVAEAFGTQRVAVTVKGVANYQLLTQFKTALSGAATVKDLNQRTFANNVATLDLECEGSAEKLADTLAMASFPGYTLEIDKVTANTLEMTLRSAGGKR